MMPWNYAGTEGTGYDSGGDPANGKAGYPSTVVDWVLVSLRDKGDVTGVTLCRKAGLLHSDGHIEFPGGGFACCDIAQQTGYYVVVEHRNHLIIMSPTAIPVVNGKMVVDFRTIQSYIDPIWVGFAVGQKPAGDGRYMMYGGNGDQVSGNDADTDTNADDRTWWEKNNGDFGYRSGDYDLSGDTNQNDRTLWERNNSKFTSVPRN